MSALEPTNLCETCNKMVECLQQGIYEREKCDKYDPMSMNDLLERDKFVREIMVGACPICGSENAYDSENNPLLEDNTIGHCLDCETYWCTECGYIFKELKKGMECPHWEMCNQCSKEEGRLDTTEFNKKICPKCEHYHGGCGLEEPTDCDKQWMYMCDYETDVTKCPRIEELLNEQT